MTRTRRAGRLKGFTLVELVVTVTIVGVIAALAVPSMRQLYLTQQVRGAAADLQSALYYARSEAIKRAATVGVAAATGGWQNGWTVNLGSDADSCNAGGAKLRSQSALSDQFSVATASTVAYGRDGRACTGVTTITFKTANTAIPSRCVVVDLSGRPAVVYAGDSAGDSCS